MANSTKSRKTSVRNGKRKSGYLYQSSGSDRFNGRYAFFNEKNAENERTTTHITKLSEEESIREVARLLGGAEITKNVLDTAKEMKDMANRTK